MKKYILPLIPVKVNACPSLDSRKVDGICMSDSYNMELLMLSSLFLYLELTFEHQQILQRERSYKLIHNETIIKIFVLILHDPTKVKGQMSNKQKMEQHQTSLSE